jgi:hypothetical protein
LKKTLSRLRSKNSIRNVAVITGKVSRISTLTTNIVHVNSGIRNIVMPGARRQITVVTTLTAVSVVDTPVRASDMIHRSAPTPGE